MADAPATGPPVEITTSPGFTDWLREHDISLALTTYQTHRLMLLGVKADGSLSAFERLFDRPMGLAASGERIWMATRHQLWRFENVLGAGETHDGFDRMFVPRAALATGELDVHDMALDGHGRVVFVNTRYGCLATTDPVHSFRLLWRPPFLSRTLPEDRCHLNGLAMGADGEPAYVTAVSRSDVAGGWRDRRADGGVVLRVPTGETVASGLSMPHSPRLDASGTLWALDSGNGHLVRLGTSTGEREEVAFLPGFARGLALHGDHAIVGLSLPRGSKVFEGLPLQAALKARDAVARCGLLVIERSTGRTLHWLSFHGVIRELYDVQVLPGVARPTALGIKDDALQRTVTFVDEDDALVRHTLHREAQAARAAMPTPGLPTSRPEEQNVRFAARTLPLADVADRLGAVLPRRLLLRAQQRRLADPLRLVTAHRGAEAVGVAVGQQDGSRDRAEALHVWVAEPERRQGLGTALLAGLEDALSSSGAHTIEATFRKKSALGAEALLSARSWETPRAIRVLFRTDVARVQATGILDESAIPDGYRALPWRELTDDHWHTVHEKREDAPAVLDPLQEPERRDDDVSLALLRGEELAGWVVMHRVGPGTLQFTSYWLDPSVRRQGLSVPFMAEMVRRMRAGEHHRAIFMVDAANAPMLALARGPLARFVEEADEIHASRKRLGASG